MHIPFEQEYRDKYAALLEEIFDSGLLSHGPITKRFEEKFSAYSGLHASAIANGGAGLLSLLRYVGVEGNDVIVPTNTFMATPLAVRFAGGNVVFADCKKEDLCIGVEQIEKVVTSNTKAVIVVHIGGHIAFDIEAIVAYCNLHNLALIEDCAHAHGALYKGKMAGSYGIGGSYSFYATKTMPMGEGGMVVSQYPEVIEWVNKFRNYGKEEYAPGRFTYPVEGFNFRMSEIMAAFGLIQMERLPKILEWKRTLAKKYDEIFDSAHRIIFPEGMESGYYKYIVFDREIKEKTGAVFDELCHNLMGVSGSFPNSEWIATHHICPPMYFGWEHAEKSVDAIASIFIP